MSGLLDTLSQDFSYRIEIRRKMMAHLGLHPTDREAEEFRDDLRATLLSCARCPHTSQCERWMGESRPGTPAFCPGRDSFLRLERALAGTEPLRLSA